MAGRNWTRKSIEEMIDAYARKRLSALDKPSPVFSEIGGWYDRRQTTGWIEIEDGVYDEILMNHSPVIGCLDYNPDLARYNAPPIQLVAPAMAGYYLNGNSIIDIVNREVGTGIARPSIQFVAYCDGYDHVHTGGRSLIINTARMQFSSGMDYFANVPDQGRRRVYFRPLQNPRTYGTTSNYVGKIYVGRVIYDYDLPEESHDTVLFRLTGNDIGNKGLYWGNSLVTGSREYDYSYRSVVLPIPSGSIEDLQDIMSRTSVTDIYTKVPSTVVVLCCFWQTRKFYQGTSDKTIIDLFNYVAAREFNIYPYGDPFYYKTSIQDYYI